MSEAYVQQKSVVKKEKYLGLLGEKSFLQLWLTYLASSLSVSFFLFITNWYVVDYLQLEAMLGLVFFASSVPRIGFMLIGGAIADRVSKTRIMFISDITKGITLIGVIILLITDSLSIWYLVGLSLIFGILDAFFWPASTSLLPNIVKNDDLTRANSILNMTRQFSFISGPLLASLLLGFGGYVIVFALTSILLLVAGVIDLRIKVSSNNEEQEEATVNNEEPAETEKLKDQVRSIIRSIKEGLLYVKKSTFLLALMSTSIFLNLFFTGPYMLGMPIFVRNVLEGNEYTYSLITGSLTAGMFAGTFIIGAINPKKKRGLISVLSILSLSILFLVLSLSTTLWITLPVVILMGLSTAFANAPLAAVVQHHTPKEYLGRVMSLIAFAAMGLTPISHLLTSTLLAVEIPINTIMLTAASCLCVFTIYTLIKAKPLREVD